MSSTLFGGDAATHFTPASARNVFFAAPADDPRARRAIDVVRLVVSLLVAVTLGWLYESRSDIDGRVFTLFSGQLPGWLSGVATIVFIAGGVFTFGLIIGIATLGHGRVAIARDMVLAVVVAVGLGVVASYAFGPEFPDLFPEFRIDGIPSYPVARLATAVAAIRVATPYLAVPMRSIGRKVLWLMGLATLVMNYGTVSAVIGGAMVGVAAAATIHLVFGSGLGIPSRARIVSALTEAGMDVADIEFLDSGRGGVFLVKAIPVNGDPVLVKLYGRDAADAAVAARLWRATWYRDSGYSLSVTSQQLAEHDALVMLALEREGIPALRLVGWGRAATGDTLVVTQWPEGRRLAVLTEGEIDDATLDQTWQALDRLHTTAVVHGGIDAEHVILGGPEVIFDHFDQARILAGEPGRVGDRVQLLVATATVVGSERAIAAARRTLGDERLMALLPLMQTAALPRPLQRQLKQADLKLKKLRAECAAALGVPVPDAAELHRVSWGSVAMAALTLFAAYSLISSLLDIGIDTITDQLANASWGWVVLAFVLAQSTNFGEYLSLWGVMGRPIPLGPTLMFRYAMSFISLAVPSEAGTIAMNVRYQQKLGVPAAAAIAQGPLLTIFSKGFDIILLAISARFLGQALDTESIEFGPIIRLIFLICIVAVVAVGVVFAVPKFRAVAMPRVKEGFHAIKGSLTDPTRLFRLIAGTLTQKILFAMALSAAVAAFGTSLSFGEAIFVNCAVSLFVGFVPVPGGIGVAEAALTAGLVAVGIPEEVALAAAIVHRMLTAYIPPVFGWWSSRWLAARDYL